MGNRGSPGWGNWDGDAEDGTLEVAEGVVVMYLGAAAWAAGGVGEGLTCRGCRLFAEVGVEAGADAEAGEAGEADEGGW